MKLVVCSTLEIKNFRARKKKKNTTMILKDSKATFITFSDSFCFCCQLVFKWVDKGHLLSRINNLNRFSISSG